MKKVWIRRYDDEHECVMKVQVTESHTEHEPLEFSGGGPHEEGWSSYCERYWMDEHGFVFSTSESDGCDCDGRLSRHWEGMWNGRTWIEMASGQRDYNAEAAGY